MVMNAPARPYILAFQNLLPGAALRLFAIGWGRTKNLKLLEKGDIHARRQRIESIRISFSPFAGDVNVEHGLVSIESAPSSCWFERIVDACLNDLGYS